MAGAKAKDALVGDGAGTSAAMAAVAKAAATRAAQTIFFISINSNEGRLRILEMSRWLAVCCWLEEGR